MDAKLARIATVLAALPEQMRVDLARRLLTSAYAIVPRNCNGSIESVFKGTARRFHSALRTDLKFNQLAIAACWQAMVTEAARQSDPIDRDAEMDRHEEVA